MSGELDKLLGYIPEYHVQDEECCEICDWRKGINRLLVEVRIDELETIGRHTLSTDHVWRYLGNRIAKLKGGKS